MTQEDAGKIYASMKVYGPHYNWGRDGWWMDTFDALMARGIEQEAAEAFADEAMRQDIAAQKAIAIARMSENEGN